MGRSPPAGVAGGGSPLGLGINNNNNAPRSGLGLWLLLVNADVSLKSRQIAIGRFINIHAGVVRVWLLFRVSGD